MDEQKRFIRFVFVLVAVFVVGAVFAVGSAVLEIGDWYSIVSVIILVGIAVLAIVLAREKQKELKSGFPLDDERSKALKMRAGYLAFWVSMYFCLALGWIIGAFIDNSDQDFLSTGEMMFVLVAAMGVFYIVIWAAISRGKGMP